MKVDPKSAMSSTGASGGPRPAADGFRLLLPGEAGAARGPAAPASVGAMGGVTGVNGLLALQGVPSPEARARALRKGRRLLDALDRLQLAMLGDGPRLGNLAQLQGALADPREPSGDPGLDEAVGWAEVRAAVEAAKLSRPLETT